MYYISIVRILLVISQYCNCSCMIQRGLGTFSGIMSSSHHYLLTDFSGAFLIRNDKFLSVEKWPINFLKGRCSKIYLCDQFGEKRIRGKINCISQTRIARNLSRYRHCVLDRSFESWPKMFRTLFKIKHVLQIWRFVNRRVITPVNFVICVTWRHSKWKKKKKKTSINPSKPVDGLVKNLFSSRMVAKTYFSFRAKFYFLLFHWYLSTSRSNWQEIKFSWMGRHGGSTNETLIASRSFARLYSFPLIHRSLTFTLNLLWLYLKIRISIKLAAMRNLISIQGRQREILARLIFFDRSCSVIRSIRLHSIINSANETLFIHFYRYYTHVRTERV